MPILHIDMDCFFAAVEEREHPEYKGKPLIVGADPFGRGVVATCNYEARKFGIHSAMPISKAFRLCPEGIFVRPQFDLYVQASRRIKQIIRRYADAYESGGIDEAYCDISSTGSYERAEQHGRDLQQAIFTQEQLTCSIGIGPNTLVAKIASDFRKPNGMTIVKPEDVQSFLAPLPVRKLIGVGPKTEARLHAEGIFTIGQLQHSGGPLQDAANGIGSTKIGGYYEAKSIGAQRTFYEDTKDVEKILLLIAQLCEEITEQLQFYFRTVTLVVRFADFETHTTSFTLKFATDDVKVLYSTAVQMLVPYFQDPRKIRLVGVRMTNLQKMRDTKLYKE